MAEADAGAVGEGTLARPQRGSVTSDKLENFFQFWSFFNYYFRNESDKIFFKI
jgi:hypothetical protein